MLYAALAVGEDIDKLAVSARTGQLPLPQCVDDQWWQRNSAPAGSGLRTTDGAPLIGALPHCDRGLGEIHVAPCQAPQLRGPETGQGSCDEERPAVARSSPENDPDLCRRGNVNTDLQTLLMALCGFAAPLTLMDRVANGEPAL